MSNREVVLVFEQSRRTWLGSSCQQIVEIVESFSEGSYFFLLALDEDLKSEHFIGGVVFGNERHAIGGIGLGRSCKVASLDSHLDVHVKELIEQFWAFFLSLIKAVFPITVFFKCHATFFILA